MAGQMPFLTKSQQLIFVRRTNTALNTVVQIISKTLTPIQPPINALGEMSIWRSLEFHIMTFTITGHETF